MGDADPGLFLDLRADFFVLILMRLARSAWGVNMGQRMVVRSLNVLLSGD
jgi:hypothetical protein